VQINKIGSLQINLIKKCKKFILQQKKIDVDVSRNPSCYLPGWSKEYGNFVLKSLTNKNNKIEKIYHNLKEIFKYYKFSNIEVFNENIKKVFFKRLVITWGLSSDFKNNQNYFDRYFSMKAKDNKDTLWIVIFADNKMEIPKSYDNNVIIVKNRSGKFTKFLFSAFLIIFKSIFAITKNEQNKLNSKYLNGCKFDEKLKDCITHILETYKIKQVLLPYECQPFQNFLFKEMHRKYPKIVTIGYIHSALPPLPTDFIKREGSPKFLLVHGKDQKKILVEKLGWKSKEVFEKKSMRYRNFSKVNFFNKIFLPMSFENDKLILDSFENYLSLSKNLSLPNLKIRNHPVMKTSKKHLLLIKKIQHLIRKYENKFSKKKKIKKVSIFVSATAAIIEALERGVDVIHIFSQPIYESHNSKIWKNLKVTFISDNVFRYKLKKYGKYIYFGNKNKTLNRWLKKKIC